MYAVICMLSDVWHRTDEMDGVRREECVMAGGNLVPDVPDVVGMPWDLAKGLLNEAHIRYNSVITYPTKSFFPLEDNGYYVVRQRGSDDGVLEITLAARLLKEVSGNGL